MKAKGITKEIRWKIYGHIDDQINWRVYEQVRLQVANPIKDDLYD